MASAKKSAAGRNRKRRGEAIIKKRQRAFLVEFRKYGTIKHAADKTGDNGINRETVRRWRREDPEFDKAFQDADLDVTEDLEVSALRDALRGSERTREFLLRARNPKKYRDTTKVELEGEVTQTKRIVLVFPEAA